MNISDLHLTDILNMLYQKVMELLNLGKIDISKITSTFLIGIGIIFTTTFILWIFRAIGLYKMAKNNGDKYAFLAFIPGFCFYTQGKIVSNTKIFGIQIEHAEFLLPFLLLSMMFIPITKPLVFILFTLFYLALLYRIYQQQVPNFAIILLILSIFIPFLQPFILFFIGNSNSNNISKA